MRSASHHNNHLSKYLKSHKYNAEKIERTSTTLHARKLTTPCCDDPCIDDSELQSDDADDVAECGGNDAVQDSSSYRADVTTSPDYSSTSPYHQSGLLSVNIEDQFYAPNFKDSACDDTHCNSDVITERVGPRFVGRRSHTELKLPDIRAGNGAGFADVDSRFSDAAPTRTFPDSFWSASTIISSSDTKKLPSRQTANANEQVLIFAEDSFCGDNSTSARLLSPVSANMAAANVRQMANANTSHNLKTAEESKTKSSFSATSRKSSLADGSSVGSASKVRHNITASTKDVRKTSQPSYGYRQQHVKPSFTTLPDEMILKIFGFLAPAQLLSMACVCKRWLGLANDNVIWHSLYLKYVRPGKGEKSTSVPERPPVGYWKTKCINRCAEQKHTSVFTKLKKIDPFTGLPKATETVLQKLSVRWVLGFVDVDGEERCVNNNDAFWFRMSVCVRWYSLVLPSSERIRKLRVYAAKPILFDDAGNAITDSPCQRSLLMDLDFRPAEYIAAHQPIGQDDALSVHACPGGIIFATWKSGGELAFVTVSLHAHQLVERSLLGASSRAHVIPRPMVKRSDHDSRHGLHGYSCTLELRNQRVSIWNQQFTNVFCRPDDVGAGVALFQLINAEHGYERSSFSKKIELPWKTEAFNGKVPNLCWLDVTLLDDQKSVMWHACSAVALQRHEHANMRYDYDGEQFALRLSEPTGGVNICVIWEESTQQYFITAIDLRLSVSFINQRFGTRY